MLINVFITERVILFRKFQSFLLITLLAVTSLVSAQEWQQQRIDASSNPDAWIKKTSELIKQYDNQRQYEELAMAYALQVEAYRYSGHVPLLFTHIALLLSRHMYRSLALPFGTHSSSSHCFLPGAQSYS